MCDNRSAYAGSLLEKLAQSTPNDAVKLLYLGADDVSELERLDLTLLSEIKRGAKGEIELKFTNRLDIIRELISLEAETEQLSSGAGAFWAALDKSARMLGEEKPNEV